MIAIALPDRPRILVVTLRRLGDVLLTTPLIRGLRRAYSGAVITALVLSGTEGVLEGNPDLDATITVSVRPGALEVLSLARRLWRDCDLAVSTPVGRWADVACHGRWPPAWRAGRGRWRCRAPLTRTGAAPPPGRNASLDRACTTVALRPKGRYGMEFRAGNGRTRSGR